MNYPKHYDALIQRARLRTTPAGYTERHHIIPRCMGGGNGKENIVRLTAEEHFVAHQLLVKIYPHTKGLIYAAKRLATAGAAGNNKCYGWLKRKQAQAMSERVITDATRNKISLAQRGRKRTAESVEKSRVGNLANKRKVTEEAKAHLRKCFAGKPLTPEHCAKLSEARKGKPVHAACQAAALRANKGSKMPQHVLALLHTPEVKQKRINAIWWNKTAAEKQAVKDKREATRARNKAAA